jgi:CRISPR-associated protein Cas2
MYMIASFDCRFKTAQENIEITLQHFVLRKIQMPLYVGNLDNGERELLIENVFEMNIPIEILKTYL